MPDLNTLARIVLTVILAYWGISCIVVLAVFTLITGLCLFFFVKHRGR